MGPEDKNNNQNNDNNQQPVGSDKTLTVEAHEKAVKEASDKAVAEAKAAWEKETAAKVQEAEKLAKLNDDDRKKAELDKKQAEVDQKAKEIAAREMKLTTTTLLAEKNLPADFADLLMSQDEETTKANIAKFESQFNTAVQKAVEAKIAGKTPIAGEKAVDESKLSDDEFFNKRFQKK